MRVDSIVPSAEVLAGRNLRSWTALAFSAGCVNASAFLACSRFVTHVTGILTYAGVDEDQIGLAADYILVLCSFIAGAMSAVFILDGRRLRGKHSVPWLPLATVATLLVGIAVAGQLGWFGVFGAEVESTRDFVLLGILAFAMGLQNASVANASGGLVRTTHMTGPATDLGVALAFLMLPDAPADTRWTARRMVILRASKMVGFALGAVTAALLVPFAGFLIFLLPATISTVVALAVFSKADIRGGPQTQISLTDA